MSSYSTSGPIQLVVRICETLTDSECLFVQASRISSAKEKLSDHEWFDRVCDSVGYDGLLGFLDPSSWDDILPGFYLLEGHMFSEYSYEGEYDGGFEIERCEPFDVEKFIRETLQGDVFDLACYYQARLTSDNPFAREDAHEKISRLQEVLYLLREMYEEES